MRGMELDKALKNCRKHPILLGIDGACATGKTTLGRKISQEKGGSLLHMDDFFLPFDQRGSRDEIGSNINKSLFLNQVLLPLSQGGTARFQAFDCAKGEYGEERVISPTSLVIIEGVYVFLPEFRDYFSLKVFLKANWVQRKQRLLERGSKMAQFEAEWIPREEKYFSQCKVEDCCDLLLDTT